LLDGNVHIWGFQAGAGFGDRIDLRDVSGLTFDWLIAHAATVDGNAVLDLGNGEHMTLVGVGASSIASDDFLLGG
jgi:hypothetical protein